MSVPTPAAVPGNMAAHQQPQPQPQPPPRTCMICCNESDETKLVKPCRGCSVDYCQACVAHMFESATTDNTQMPPKCCNLIQIHTATTLSDEAANAYRAKFEEYITLNKTYCPSPTCSAFLSDRLLPSSEQPAPVTLQSILTDVLRVVVENPSARFFRGELSITDLPGYTAVVAHPMDLSMMQDRVPGYKSVDEMTMDFTIIVKNAKKYNGAGHPIAKTADQLFLTYMGQLSVQMGKLVAISMRPKAADHFLCPKCHIGICSKCKQIEHSGIACDTTSQDHEVAMLAQYGYKRCPLCRHAVKKMYGCSHMQCICGAHWCYYCQQSVHECDGNCVENRGESEDEEDYDEDEDEDDIATSDISQEPLDALEPALDAADQTKPAADGKVVVQAPAVPPPRAAVAPAWILPEQANQSPAASTAPAVQPPSTIPPPATQRRDNRIVNLDAGGARRWQEADYDFGEEPEEDGSPQIWACGHSFESFCVVDDGFYHGDLSKMECNKCFKGVWARPPAKAPPKSKKSTVRKLFSGNTKTPGADCNNVIDEALRGDEETEAMECRYCRFVVCKECR